jgi:tol-pal system protein YbgF
LFLAGCAGTPVRAPDVAEQERLLVTLRAQNAAYVRQIEELQNRIFLLEDRFDSRRTAAAEKACAPPSPPAVVTLSGRPRDPEGNANRPPSEPPASAGRVDAATVELPKPVSGAAAASTAPTGAFAGEVTESRPPSGQGALTTRQVRKLLAAQQAEERRQEKLRWKEDLANASRGDASSLDIPAAPATSSHVAQPAPSPFRPVSSPPASSFVGSGRSADDSQPAPLAEGDSAALPGATGPYLSLETPVEYVGEAARTSTRPVLRLHGSEKPASSRKGARSLSSAIAAELEGPDATAPTKRTETRARGSAPLASSRTVRQRPKARPLDLYETALAALRAHDHERALAGFRRFVALHPHHDYADNAQYWMGECFYDQGDYTHAAEEFRRVVERYPHGNKVPDAMLKLGFSLAADGDPAAATRVLASLVKGFPRNQAARLASQRLAEPALGVLRSTPAGRAVSAPRLKAQATFGASLSALAPESSAPHVPFPGKPPGPETP